MFVSSYRITKFALQNFWRNFWLSIITLSMLVLTLVTINILLVLNFVTNQAIQTVEERIEVSVYFDKEVEQSTVDSAVEYLRGISQVRDVVVVDPEKALENFSKNHKDDESIMASLEELDSNPFGPTLIVKSYTAEDFDIILDALENPEFSDFIREKDFSDYQAIVSRIKDTTDNIRFFGMVMSAVFLLIAVLIVFNTVRIGIFIHKEEIGIMKLVGATNWFVKAPFILEMIILSFVAVGIVVLVSYPVLAILESKFALFFGGVQVGLINYFEINGLNIFGTQLMVLIAITVISTLLAMRRYLKV